MVKVLRMTCPQCGAAIKRGDGRFCSHCAAALPDRPRITPDEWSTHAERFDEAEGDAQHAAALSAPAPEPSWGSTVILSTSTAISSERAEADAGRRCRARPQLLWPADRSRRAPLRTAVLQPKLRAAADHADL
jgi:hypothetical protein